LKLNWLGFTVSDFAAAFHFYTAVLGMNAIDAKPDFAYFETTGMTLELFSGGIPPSPHRSWGQGQAVRPSIQVADLQGTIAELRQRGVQFTGDIQRAAWGEWIEFMAPEQIRWTLAHAPSYPYAASLHRAHIGWVELKVHRLAEQRAFYRDVMGLKPEEGKEGQVILRQEPGEPLMFLASGGQPAAPLQVSQGLLQPAPPHTISFETDHIEQAAAWLKSQKIPTVIDVTRREWGGIDLILTDMDGNPVQVVQYGAAVTAE
jgi:catechol 2,3-dioxygenase-like lactoylglutathione lyase family enzyme